MAGEVTCDEPQSLAIDRYKTTVYFTVLDSILTSISNRFKESRDVLNDLSILSPARIKSFGKESSPNLPVDAFQKLGKWLPKLDQLALKNEYKTFSKSINALIDGMSPNILHKNERTFLFENNQASDIKEPFIDSEEETCDTDNNTGVDSKQLFEVLTNFGILHSFPNLHYAYKALLTIPTSSASAERAFSKVKLIKTRLRSTIKQETLESLMILNCEKDINIDHNLAIDTFAATSDLLKDSLLFK